MQPITPVEDITFDFDLTSPEFYVKNIDIKYFLVLFKNYKKKCKNLILLKIKRIL